jgi:hypothetical protein
MANGGVDTVALRYPHSPKTHGNYPLLHTNGVRQHVLAVLYDSKRLHSDDCGTEHPRTRYTAGHEVYIFIPTTEQDPSEVELPDPAAESWPYCGPEKFLRPPFYRAAYQVRDRFTLVGMETLPPRVFARYGFSEADLALATGDRDEWAATVRSRILDQMQDTSRGPVPLRYRRGTRNYWRFDAPPVKDYVEVLTLAEYRARVEQEAWAVQTFADRTVA